VVHQQIPGVFCRFHKQLPHSKKCVWGVNFSLTEKMKKNRWKQSKTKNTISLKDNISNCSLNIFSQSVFSGSFIKVFLLKVVSQSDGLFFWGCHQCGNACQAKSKTLLEFMPRCKQLPKIYMSTPKYLLCIKSSEHITADAPGMPLNNLQGLLPGKRCQVCGVQHVETQGAEVSKFFHELCPSASAWQRTQHFFLVCHLGSLRTLAK
jgi:hypothetical protein